MGVPWCEARYPAGHICGESGVLDWEGSAQGGFLIGQDKDVRYEPCTQSVNENADIAEEERLAEYQRYDCDIHGVADEAIGSGDDEVLGWKDGRGRAETLECETEKRFKQNDEACRDHKTADDAKSGETKER